MAAAVVPVLAPSPLSASTLLIASLIATSLLLILRLLTGGAASSKRTMPLPFRGVRHLPVRAGKVADRSASGRGTSRGRERDTRAASY
jgi:hypothetical protein